MGSFRVAHVDEVEPLIEDEWAAWRPVRHFFGIGAFGVNAWIGRAAGDEVIEEHDEGSEGHEELYVVLTGSATFTIDGETARAPAGTLVFVRPGTTRIAVADEPGTRILAVGARPGTAFAPSAWELRHTEALT